MYRTVPSLVTIFFCNFFSPSSSSSSAPGLAWPRPAPTSLSLQPSAQQFANVRAASLPRGERLHTRSQLRAPAAALHRTPSFSSQSSCLFHFFLLFTSSHLLPRLNLQLNSSQVVFCAFGLTTTERFLLVAQLRGQENARIWVASAGIFSGSGEEVFGLMVFSPFSTPTAELVYDLRV